MERMINVLENFIIKEGYNLDKLNFYLKQPNYLEILGIPYAELQHSNFLAWMLRPNESHGIGDCFLKNFLNIVEMKQEDKIRLNLVNLSKTKILREYKNIDLLIVNDELKFVVCIENKIKAGKSGDNQLVKYHDVVEDIWGNLKHKRYYVYLTPFPRFLDEKEENYGYKNITYSCVLKFLEDTVKNVPPSPEVRPLIDNYISNLKKNIMGVDKQVLLAQEIYTKHKNVIDFIMKHKPQIKSDELFEDINRHFINHKEYLNITPADEDIIRILPKDVFSCFNLGSESWDDTDSVFALEIFIENEKIWVKFCFGNNNVENVDELEEIEERRVVLFNSMKKFSSLKGISKKTRITSFYPAVAKYDIMKLGDKVVLDTDNYYDAFIKAFDEFEGKILNRWTEEVKKILV